MNPSPSKLTAALILASSLQLLAAGGGCSLSDLQTPDRREHGLVLVLPGVEGRSVWNHEIARGLADGGVQCAIEIFDWGTPVPGGMLINLADLERNRGKARELADRIVAYRRNHPSKPIHLVAHSGGAGVALMAVEDLPDGVQVSTVILLAPAVSPDYDLRPALRKSRYGVFNYYSELDVALLRAGTTLAGTTDRKHGQAAGAVGFSRPHFPKAADDRLYDRKLHQTRWSPEMGTSLNFGGHLDWAHRPFVTTYLAPLIIEL